MVKREYDSSNDETTVLKEINVTDKTKVRVSKIVKKDDNTNVAYDIRQVFLKDGEWNFGKGIRLSKEQTIEVVESLSNELFSGMTVDEHDAMIDELNNIK